MDCQKLLDLLMAEELAQKQRSSEENLEDSDEETEPIIKQEATHIKQEPPLLLDDVQDQTNLPGRPSKSFEDVLNRKGDFRESLGNINVNITQHLKSTSVTPAGYDKRSTRSCQGMKQGSNERKNTMVTKYSKSSQLLATLPMKKPATISQNQINVFNIKQTIYDKNLKEIDVEVARSSKTSRTTETLKDPVAHSSKTSRTTETLKDPVAHSSKTSRTTETLKDPVAHCSKYSPVVLTETPKCQISSPTCSVNSAMKKPKRSSQNRKDARTYSQIPGTSKPYVRHVPGTPKNSPTQVDITQENPKIHSSFYNSKAVELKKSEETSNENGNARDKLILTVDDTLIFYTLGKKAYVPNDSKRSLSEEIARCVIVNLAEVPEDYLESNGLLEFRNHLRLLSLTSSTLILKETSEQIFRFVSPFTLQGKIPDDVLTQRDILMNVKTDNDYLNLIYLILSGADFLHHRGHTEQIAIETMEFLNLSIDYNSLYTALSQDLIDFDSLTYWSSYVDVNLIELFGLKPNPNFHTKGLKMLFLRAITHPQETEGVNFDGMVIWECQVCRQLFDGLNACAHHFLRSEGLYTYNCKHCGFLKFTNRCAIIYHAMIDKVSPNKYEFCLSCGKNYFSLIGHLSGCHKNVIRENFSGRQDILICDSCSFYTDVPCELYYHNQIHLKNKPFLCLGCKGIFFTKIQFTNHFRNCYVLHMHLVFVCPLCKIHFTEFDDFANHVYIKHYCRFSVCSICGIGFRNVVSFKDHVKTYHPENPSLSSKILNACLLCKGANFYGTSQFEHFKQHIFDKQVSKAVYRCRCSFVTLSINKLKSHMQESCCPPSAKEFKNRYLKLCNICCEICPSNFTDPFTCDKCQFLLEEPNATIYYKCNVCAKLMDFNFEMVIIHFKFFHKKSFDFINKNDVSIMRFNTSIQINQNAPADSFKKIPPSKTAEYSVQNERRSLNKTRKTSTAIKKKGISKINLSAQAGPSGLSLAGSSSQAMDALSTSTLEPLMPRLYVKSVKTINEELERMSIIKG